MQSVPPVRLTSLRESDSPILYSWLSDRDHRLFSSAFEHVTPEGHQHWFDRVRTAIDGASLAVRPSDHEDLLGLAQLLAIHPVHRHAELRIKLSPGQTGKGFGTEAVRQLCRFGFDDLNLQRIYLYVFSDNARAIASYGKVGFEQEGVLRRHAHVDGSYRDVAIMGLLRDFAL